MLATLTGVGGRVHAINEPVAKLTEETAAAALALNNTQLAAECCCRLKASLEEEAEAVFSDAKSVSLLLLAHCPFTPALLHSPPYMLCFSPPSLSHTRTHAHTRTAHFPPPTHSTPYPV